MRVFGTSRLFLLTIWVVCFLALGTTKSNCLYEEEKGEFDVAKGQDGDLMDDSNPSSQKLLTVFEDDNGGDDTEDGYYDDGFDDDQDNDLDNDSNDIYNNNDANGVNDDDDDDYDDDNDNDNDDGRGEDPSASKKSLCLDNECVKAAGRMISMMNQSADPCEDFHNYVCGNFQMTHEPYEDMTRTMSFEMLRRENNFILHNVLKKMSKSTGVKAIDNLKSHYDSCMKLEHNGEENSVKTIIKKYGPWPMDCEKWNPRKWNFNKMLIDISTVLPVAPLFLLSVTLDNINPNIYAFQVSQYGLGMSTEYYLSMDKQKVKIRNAYIRFMKNVMKLLGYGKKFQVTALRDVYLFEKNLAKIFLTSTMLRQEEKVYKRVSIRYLKRISPEIDWDKLFDTQLKLVRLKKHVIKFIGLHGEDYFKKLAKLLRKTKKQTLANYLLWKIVHSLYSVGGKKYRDEGFLYSQVLTGKKARSPFWSTCTDSVSSSLPFAYGRVYVDTRFKSKYAVKEAKRMVKEIKKEFSSNLDNVDWMSDNTKKKAKLKALCELWHQFGSQTINSAQANAIKELVAYPKSLLDDKKLDKLYKGLQLNKNDYLSNALKINMFNQKKMIRLLTKKRDRSEWLAGPHIVNAFYSQVYNRIVFPAGILQPLFYHHSYPSAMKYGGIGCVIGHEITHAFDDKGRKFDKTGRLHQWWDSGDIKRFEKRADCIRNQYSSYSVYGKHMNGRLSCGENIADNGGVKMAYKAFRRHLSKHPKTKALPGLHHLTDDQLFFVSFAKTWCLIEEKARTLRNIVADPHSFPKFRIIGPLSNSKEFASAFNCKVGSKMNPAKKCIIW